MTDVPALFITFEGTDGSGKSTQFSMAANALKKIVEQPVTATREPGGTTVGERIRDILLDKTSSSVLPVTELLLFAAARSQIIHQVLLPAIRRGHIVLCDRYVDSTLAYQGARPELKASDIAVSIAIATDNLLPDMTFLFDLDVEEGLKRRAGNTNRLDDEKLEFHQAVRNNYLGIARENPHRIIVIDASRNVDAIHYEVMNHILNRLKA